MGWIWIIGAVVGWWLAGTFINGPLDLFLIQLRVQGDPYLRNDPKIQMALRQARQSGGAIVYG